MAFGGQWRSHILRYTNIYGIQRELTAGYHFMKRCSDRRLPDWQVDCCNVNMGFAWICALTPLSSCFALGSYKLTFSHQNRMVPIDFPVEQFRILAASSCTSWRFLQTKAHLSSDLFQNFFVLALNMDQTGQTAYRMSPGFQSDCILVFPR